MSDKPSKCDSTAFIPGDELASFQERLEVGRQVFLEVNPDLRDSQRCKTSLLGWDSGEFLLLEKPEWKSGLTMHKGQKCAARFMKEGEIWGFYSTIEDPAPHKRGRVIQIAWPDDVACIRVRRFERTNVVLPCTIQVSPEETKEGVLVDLSVGGCRLRVDRALGEGTVLGLSFALPGEANVEQIQALVRGCHSADDGAIYHGCEFAPLTENERCAIGMFVARRLAEQRDRHQSQPRILVITRTPSEIQQVQPALDEAGIEILGVSGILELGHYLFALQPRAVLIAHDQQDVPAADIRKIVNSTPGYEEIPTVVYGGGGGSLAESVQAIGAKLYLAGGPAADQPRPVPAEVHA